MKKLIMFALALMMVCFFSVGLTACGGGGSSDGGSKEYIADTDIDAFLAGPDDFNGKYIKITGKVFSVDKDGDTIGIQCWNDVENVSGDFFAYMKSDETFKEGDYVLVDGKIEGKATGDNAFGGVIDTPQIAADSIQKGTYQEIIAPAKTTKEVGEEVDKHGVKFTVSKVEYADQQTRIYLTVKNDSDAKVSVYSNLAKVVQDGKQFEAEYTYEGDYPEIDEVVAGASAEGIVVVKPLDPEKEAEMILEPISDNWEIDMGEIKIKF